jgi:hypothetical protein
MRHKTKNRLIKKRKGRKTRKTRKIKMRRGGNPFTSMQVGIPGFGSFGSCPDKQIYDPKYGWLTQTCTETPVGPIYKTQYPDSGETSGDTENSWYDIF